MLGTFECRSPFSVKEISPGKPSHTLSLIWLKTNSESQESVNDADGGARVEWKYDFHVFPTLLSLSHPFMNGTCN